MAGFIITLDNMDSLSRCIETGSYSTIINAPRYQSWMANHEGTFADYLSMKDGDLIFFFIKRKIYGCGKLVNIGEDCKYLNYQNADCPTNDYANYYNASHLLPYGNENNRCFCLFVPYPAFFSSGVDMDEVLQNRDTPFHSLRTMWKVSFIKMDDDESNALFNIIIKNNEVSLRDGGEQFDFNPAFHTELAQISLENYRFTSEGIIRSCTSET